MEIIKAMLRCRRFGAEHNFKSGLNEESSL